MLKLHLGCGQHILPGWINIDYRYYDNIDLVHDVRKPLPYANNSVDFIFTEHLLEHFTPTEAELVLEHCYLALKPAAVIRIVVPSIETALKLYENGWQNATWVAKNNIKTRAQFLNAYFRYWGHQFIYDHDELSNLLKSTKFTVIDQISYKQSKYPDLRGLEVHNDLILEGIK